MRKRSTLVLPITENGATESQTDLQLPRFRHEQVSEDSGTQLPGATDTNAEIQQQIGSDMAVVEADSVSTPLPYLRAGHTTSTIVHSSLLAADIIEPNSTQDEAAEGDVLVLNEPSTGNVLHTLEDRPATASFLHRPGDNHQAF